MCADVICASIVVCWHSCYTRLVCVLCVVSSWVSCNGLGIHTKIVKPCPPPPHPPPHQASLSNGSALDRCKSVFFLSSFSLVRSRFVWLFCFWRRPVLCCHFIISDALGRLRSVIVDVSLYLYTVEPRYLELAYFELPIISKWNSGPCYNMKLWQQVTK